MRHPWSGLLLGAVLLLPPPGTDSRERGFCSAWLKLTAADRQQVLLTAESSESGAALDAACRAAARGPLRHLLDAECRNWNQLMDFEVRALVDRVLEPCSVRPGSSG
jgi:hypothetical protein